jgi:hypothetical protein
MGLGPTAAGPLVVNPDPSIPKPPCRESNPDHRLMACPLLGKVSCRLVQARHSLFDLTLTLPPARTVEVRHWETCRLCPICKGSVDLCLPGPGLARNWRQAAFASHLLVYQGEHPSPRGSTARPYIPHHRDSGLAARCQIVGQRGIRHSALLPHIVVSPLLSSRPPIQVLRTRRHLNENKRRPSKS